MEGSEETETDGVNEAHPNEGEIKEAVKDVDLKDSPEDVTDGEEASSGSDDEAQG